MAGRLLFVTVQGMLKVVEGSEFGVSKKTTAATKLSENDALLAVAILCGNETMVMRSKKDMFLRIDCATIPEKRKMAVGVRGMKFNPADELHEIYLLKENESREIEVKGKTIALNRLHVGNRDTKGVKK